MNIFKLDQDPVKAAKMHVDKHVVKMRLESAQMLANAYYVGLNVTKWKQVEQDLGVLDKVRQRFEGFPRTDEDGIVKPYRPAHWNHPSSKWVRENISNWNWLLKLGLALCDEKDYRWPENKNKTQKTQLVMKWMQKNPPINFLPLGQLTTIPVAGPDDYVITDNPIENYKILYTFEKSHLHQYKNRGIPKFILEIFREYQDRFLDKINENSVLKQYENIYN